MRPVRKITDAEQNHRYVPYATLPNAITSRRDPVEPEPVGTIVLMPFRVTGYDPDCDGSLMVRLEQVDVEGKSTGLTVDRIGLYPDTGLVATLDEVKKLFETSTTI